MGWSTSSEGEVEYLDGASITLKEDESITLYAIWSINQYTYTFYDEEGVTILKTETVDYASEITPPTTPVKIGNQQYLNTFTDWDKDIPETITEDVTFKAEYLQSINQYTYTFFDDDGETVLKKETLDYGSTITPPTTPDNCEGLFYDASYSLEILVSSASVDTYKSTLGWSRYDSIINPITKNIIFFNIGLFSKN